MTKEKKKNNGCVFCQIVTGQQPANIRFEDEEIVAFDDINPHAPIHILVIPKKHIESLDCINKKDEKLMGRVLYRCKALAKELGIAESGYRITINVGRWGGQIVPHLHFHLLGGAPLTEHSNVYTKTEILVSDRKKI